jgi:O-antigen/teichoic acid export membrane protein
VTTLQRLRHRPSSDREPNDLTAMIVSFAGDSFQYFIGLAVIGLANTVLVPLYTRHLSPSEFGAYALLEIVALGLTTAAGLGSNVSYLKWFAESSSDDVPQLYGTMLITGVVASGVLGLCFTFIAASAKGAAVLTISPVTFASALCPLIILETLQLQVLTHLRARRRPLAFSFVSVIRLLAIVGFTLAWVTVAKKGLAGVFWARVAGDAVGMVVALGLSWQDFSHRFCPRSAVRMIRYGAPLILASMLMMALDGVGRFFISHYGGLDQLGLYTVGIKISGIMRVLVVAPFGAAWGGLIFQIASKPQARIVYSKLFSYVLLLGTTIALVVVLLGPTLLHVFAPPIYAGAQSVIPVLLAVQVATVIQYSASVGIFVAAVTKWMTPIIVVGLGVDVVLSRLLVPEYGMQGAACALLTGWVVIDFLLYLVGQRHYRVKYERKPVALFIALCVYVYVLNWCANTALKDYAIVARLGGCLSVAVLSVAYVYRDIHREHGRQVFIPTERSIMGEVPDSHD